MMQTMIKRNINLSQNQLAEFCRRWMIDEVAFFGSVLRDDFDSGSDLDILVRFDPAANWSLLDHDSMEQELSQLMGRQIDLFSRRAVEQSHNWIRRQEILNTAEVVYAS